ncbi:MAG: sulfite exporter TauE/SafE family protein, partial [Clostridia bacterium]|nr:sulfite exporter TauE/SafE family protein [Clostridia bacterium]
MRGLLLILTGFLAGVAAGMGMGGGTLLIPALTLLLGVPQHMAQGVNVAAFLPAAAAA